MATLKTILRRIKTLLWTAFSILVIFAAVLVGIGKLLMPFSDRYQPALEAWLSEEFGRPVVLDSFEGDWTAFGPRLSLRGMTLLPAPAESPGARRDTEEEVAIEVAALDVKPLNLLIPGRPLYNFRVSGADFELLQGTDGRLKLSGFGITHREGGGQTSALRELARVGEVVLEDSSLQYQDEKYGILLTFSDIRGRLHLEGDRLAAELRASLLDSRSELVYGDLEGALQMTFGEDQKVTGTAWQATASELMLAAFQGRLPRNPFLPLTGWLNAELWGEWTKAEGHLIKGAVDLREARLVNEHQDLNLERVNSRFRWQFSGKGKWKLHLAEFSYDDSEHSWIAPRISMARDTSDKVGLWISADELPLEVPLNLARDVLSIYGTPWPKFLPRSAAGNVSDFDLVLNDRWRLELARGEVLNASVWDWGLWPDLHGLDGSIALGGGYGRLRLSGDEVHADWPRMFRDRISFAMASCFLDLRWGQGWQVNFKDCSIENDDLAAQGAVTISGNEGKPAIDVNVAVSRGDVGRLDPYWPESVLKENIKGWLRRGLAGGDILSGRLQIFGDMDDWPFRKGEGRFEAIAEVGQAKIDYLDGWPAASGVHAVARFVGASMDIRGSVGDIGGLPARSVSASIDDMKSPVLEIDYRSDSELPRMLRFLQNTPLQQQIQVDLSDFTFAGAASTDGALMVPLGKNAAAFTLDGRVDISDGYFSDSISGVTLEAINGQLSYDETGFTATALGTEFRGYPARLDLVAGTDREEKFRAGLTGVFGIRDVIPTFLLDSYSELAKIDGNCLWQGSLVVGPGEAAGSVETRLQVESGLQGVQLDLPAPLNKRADERWPLVLTWPLTGQRRLLDIEFLERLSLRFDLPEGMEAPRSAVIRLGGGLAAIPPEGFIRIEGESDDLDLDGWIDLIVKGALQGKGLGGMALEQGGVVTGRLRFLDRHFEAVGLNFSVEDADIRAEFISETIDGKVRFTSGETEISSLSAEFERLALGDPVSAGMDMETNPADLPALHLYAKSLRYAGVELGETRIEAFPVSNGFHFDKVDTSSDQLSIQASGVWSLDEEGQHSDFDIHMVSESLGDFLKSMGIASPVQGGQTLVDFNVRWPGSPAAFALSRLNGEVEFSVVDGNITGADAGTGRLLGLLSIQALPKRLSLDFRDVFDTGFSFDEASGTFVMENGKAQTDDVVLTSSAASISISGSTDLVDRQYDQLLTIRPGVGNTLPIIGALAAGPGGAAAGLALQGLLHDQLAEATQVQYTISGDWDDPQFEAVDVKRADG